MGGPRRIGACREGIRRMNSPLQKMIALGQGAAATGALARGAGVTVIAGNYGGAVQGGRKQVAQVGALAADQLPVQRQGQLEHLVEIAIVQVTLPIDAD